MDEARLDPTSGIAVLRDGGFLLLGEASADKGPSAAHVIAAPRLEFGGSEHVARK
jgi:hypothetical protein